MSISKSKACLSSSNLGQAPILLGGKNQQNSQEKSTKAGAGQAVSRTDITNESRIEANNVPVETESADSFPFIGPVPSREGHFIAAGFAGHGKQ